MSQIFILDTNIVSNSSKDKPIVAVEKWLRSGTVLPAIAFPVILEIQQGIIMSRSRNPEKAARLEAWLEWVLESIYVYPDLTPDVAILLAEMQACRPLKNLWQVDAKKKHYTVKQDLLIGALSITYGYPVATIDTTDFLLIHRHFRLPGIFNPATGAWSVRAGPDAVDGPSRNPDEIHIS